MFIRRLAVIFAVFSLLLIFYLNLGNNEKSVSQSQTITKVSVGQPVRLKIPSINVDAAIEYVGLTSSRAMEVPKNTTDVGWLKLGPRPGEKGSAVIDGHFNGKNGEEGVFANLYKLKAGDKLYIEDDKGTSIPFIVRESRIYDPGLADYVFNRNDSGTYLNLITCDGVWDGTKKSYTKRLVIFTDITH